MKRFKNILFVADETGKTCPALERAVTLAETNDARLTVLKVIDEVEEDFEVTHKLNLSLNQMLHDYTLDALSDLVAPYHSGEHVIYIKVIAGTAFAEIVKAVLQNGYDLVIKASRPPEGLGERLLGSTDLHLLRKCPCPVWIDRPEKTIPYKRILAAVDPMDDAGAATRILQLATSLAKREQAQIEVVHVWRLPGESMFRHGRARLPEDELQLLLKNQRKHHADELDKLLSDFGLSTSDDNVYLPKGNAVSRILEFGKNADLIVMSTIGRGGIPGFLIGNTAEEVMQMAQASILAVKPDGYVSPLA